jgi:hypothetical protein
MEELYLAMIVGVLFFVCKVILNKIQKQPTEQRELRDSVLVSILTGSVLWIKKTQFSGLSTKANVFVNEPGF